MARIDLIKGVYPISAVASRLAQLIKQTNESGDPVVITQKGRPQAVLLDVYVYEELTAEVERLRAALAERGDTE